MAPIKDTVDANHKYA